jgi:hypothetical protein
VVGQIGRPHPDRIHTARSQCVEDEALLSPAGDLRFEILARIQYERAVGSRFFFQPVDQGFPAGKPPRLVIPSSARLGIALQPAAKDNAQCPFRNGTVRRGLTDSPDGYRDKDNGREEEEETNG